MNWHKKYVKNANSKEISLEQMFYKKYLLYQDSSSELDNIFYKKYIKYKSKYLQLAEKLKKDQTGGTNNCLMCTGDHCMKTKDCLIAQINQIPDSAIQIEKIISGDSTKESTLVVIPGFSESSYKRNYSTLFKFYNQKLDTNNFKQTFLIKFKDTEEFSIRGFNMTFFDESNKIIDPLLENKLYQKCAEIIARLLDQVNPDTNGSTNKYTILAKSAGGGVAICLSEIIYQKIHKMFLFAPGAEYLSQTINKLKLDESKITVGWNVDDMKVQMIQVWPELSKLLPNTQVLKFNKDSYFDVEKQKQEDTQHEINSQFIQYIKE